MRKKRETVKKIEKEWKRVGKGEKGRRSGTMRKRMKKSEKE